MLPKMICVALTNVTSSQVSACGATHSDSQDGRIAALCGQVPALASLSAWRESERERQTIGTFGLTGSSLLTSADLTRSLGNRLRARTASLGSTLYRLTWKEQVTPSGRLFFRLAASALRTGESGCSSWPTPTVGNATGSQAAKGASATGRRPDGSKATVSLGAVARLACRSRAENLASGLTPNGSTAATGSIGQLNPGHSRWLMGLPQEWDACAVMAMQSMPKRRQNLSKPISDAEWNLAMGVDQ